MIFGLLAALLLASTSNNNNNGLFAVATTTSTTGGAPDAGTDASYTDCGELTVPPADGPPSPGGTPAPTFSVRCLPSSLLTTYDDDSVVATVAGTDTASIAPSVAPEETPEPTLVIDSAVPAAAAPTNEDELTGGTTDGAFGLAPPASGAALAASCGLLLVAGLLAV